MRLVAVMATAFLITAVAVWVLDFTPTGAFLFGIVSGVLTGKAARELA